MAKARPIMPAEERKLLGRDVFLFLNYGEGATYKTPKFTILGGQRSADFSSSADEIDLSDKTSGGYGDSAPGNKSTELTVELIVKPGDEAVAQLYDAHDKDEAVDILRWAKDGRSARNWYAITEISESAAYDDAVILSVTFKGKGAPTYTDNMPDPRTTV